MNPSQFVQELFASTSFTGRPNGLYEPIEYTMKLGGKRLRPQLLLWTVDLFGGDYHAAAPAALAVETFHNYTLLHDDLMDQSPLRRGQPTVYLKWNANVAILSGDTMMGLAWQHLLRQPCTNPVALFQCFNNTAIGVFEGQQLDMEFEQRDDVTIAEYMEMIRLKTAVLLAGALQMGAIVADAPSDDISHLISFGEHLGLAFQLQDDLLDAYGDTRVLGKQTGQDIIDRKKTYLLLKATELSTEQEALQLKALYNSAVDASHKVPQVIACYDRLHVKEAVVQKIDAEFQLAEQALARVDRDEAHKSGLRQLAQSLLGRQK